jgi:hypothetical protein
MSDNGAGEGMALNWRGPLLAAGIFAGVLAILLLMARQNQSKASDQGSSFRQDPYGTSLLFDSYKRAGYQLERSEDEDSLDDQSASQTTAFFVGGFSYDDWNMEGGTIQTGKFRGRLEKFLSRGGRVVLVNPAPDLALKSKSQGWEVQNEWKQHPKNSGPGWVAPVRTVMPAGSEMMYLSADAPWLKANAHWTPLYSGPVNEGDPSQTNTMSDEGSSAHVYMARWQIGKGELIAASQETFLLNEAIKTHPNPVLLDFLAGGRPVIWVDETLHGLYQDEGVLWLVQRYRLDAALLIFWSALLALLWSMSGDLIRRPARDWSTEIIRRGENAGVAGQRLLQRSIASDQVLAECWEQFRRRSPHDAQAISADPHCGPQLRTALEKTPLDGYRKLTELIAERRTSAKALVRAPLERHDENSASPKTTAEEARIA